MQHLLNLLECNQAHSQGVQLPTLHISLTQTQLNTTEQAEQKKVYGDTNTIYVL